MLNNKFSGWKVLIGLFIVYFFTNGIVTNTLPTLFPSIAKELCFTPVTLGNAVFIMYLSVAVLSFFSGAILDKFNPKKLMYIGTFFFMFSFILFSRVKNSGTYSFAYFLFAVSMVCCGIISSMHIISKWFIKKRGFAMGFFLVASSLGGFVFNKIATILSAKYGWQNTILYLGLATFIVSLLSIYFLVVNKPEDVGELPDGDYEAKSNIINNKSNDSSLKEVLTDSNFYLLLLVTGTMWFCILAIVTHQSSFYTAINISKTCTEYSSIPQLELSKEKMGGLIAIFYLCSVFGKLVFGILNDVVKNRKNLLLFSILLLVIGSIILCLVSKDKLWLAYIFAPFYGFAFAGVFTMIQTIIAYYYAGNNYGKILGLVTMIDTIAGALGAMIVGIMAKQNGNFSNAFKLLLILSAVSLIAGFFLKTKEKELI